MIISAHQQRHPASFFHFNFHYSIDYSLLFVILFFDSVFSLAVCDLAVIKVICRFYGNLYVQSPSRSFAGPACFTAHRLHPPSPNRPYSVSRLFVLYFDCIISWSRTITQIFHQSKHLQLKLMMKLSSNSQLPAEVLSLIQVSILLAGFSFICRMKISLIRAFISLIFSRFRPSFQFESHSCILPEDF